MQISVAGASLLAQMVPIGLLIIAVESRVFRPRRGAEGRRRVLQLIEAWVARVVVSTGVVASGFCWYFVNAAAPITREWQVWLVTLGGYGVYLLAATMLMSLAWDSLAPRPEK